MPELQELTVSVGSLIFCLVSRWNFDRIQEFGAKIQRFRTAQCMVPCRCNIYWAQKRCLVVQLDGKRWFNKVCLDFLSSRSTLCARQRVMYASQLQFWCSTPSCMLCAWQTPFQFRMCYQKGDPLVISVLCIFVVFFRQRLHFIEELSFVLVSGGLRNVTSGTHVCIRSCYNAFWIRYSLFAKQNKLHDQVQCVCATRHGEFEYRFCLV